MTYLPGRSTVAGVTSAAQPGMVNVAIVNSSTVLTDAQVQAIVPALQQQVTRDFAPFWHRDAKLTFYSNTNVGNIPASFWWIVVLDTSDVAQALGYHTLTSAGLPMGKVFAKTAMDNNLSWTVTASHELLEVLANPNVDLYTFVQSSDMAGVLYPLETGDPVEADAIGYTINGFLLSNFVTPAWFQGWRSAGSARFDFGNKLTQPLQLASGGYVQTYAATGTGFTQTVQQHEISAPQVTTGSRPELRVLPADQRRASVPVAAAG